MKTCFYFGIAVLMLGFSGHIQGQPSCAQRTTTGAIHYKGKQSVSMPTLNVPDYVINGLREGSMLWNSGCNQNNVPNFTLDETTAPPADGSYDPTQTIQIVFEDREPEWDPIKMSWTAAYYESGAGVSRIVIPGQCPAPQGTIHFEFCDPKGMLIAWGTKHGQRALGHELGHALGLGHDTCSPSSIMQAKTPSNGQVLDKHCDLANVINCDPATLPPGQSCPPATDVVSFNVTFSGVDANETVHVTRSLSDGAGVFQNQMDVSSVGGMQISFPDLFVGWQFTMSTFITNLSKSCTVAPGSGVAAMGSPITVAVTCQCNNKTKEAVSETALIEPGLKAACPFAFPRSRLGPFVPIYEPFFEDPWYDDSWGPGFSGGFPCERQTVCTEGPPQVVVVNGVEITTATLNCVDMCVNKAVGSLTFFGPSTAIEFPAGNVSQSGSLLIEGWAVDVNNVSAVVFYVDGQKVTLGNYQFGIYRPDICAKVPAVNAANCNPNRGFSGVLDTSGLSSGVHTLSAIAIDQTPLFPVATLHEITFSVPAGCGDMVNPTVSFNGIQNGSTLQMTAPTLTLTANASDNAGGSGIEKVRFYVDGVSVQTDFSAPYTYVWAATVGSHSLKAVAFDNCGNQKAVTVSVTVDADPPSSVPGLTGRIGGVLVNGLTTALTNPTVAFSWNHATDPTGIERYQLVLQPVGGPFLYQPEVLYPATSQNLATSGLQVGTRYSIHIRAKNKPGVWGPFVAGGSFTVSAAEPPTSVPNFVGKIGGVNLSGLTIANTSPSIAFTWSHPSDPFGIERYQIVLQPTTGGWLYDHQVLYPATSYTMTTSGLQPGVSYSVHIRAKNKSGLWGPFTAASTFSIAQANPSPAVPNFIGKIGGVNLNGLTTTNTAPTVTYTWGHPSDPFGIERYQIVLQPTTGGWLYSPHVLYPATSYAMATSGLQPGTSYSVHIRAKNNAGLWSTYSNGGVFTVVAPSPPPTVPNFVGKIGGVNLNGLTVSSTSPTVTFTWTPPSDPSGIERYQIVLQIATGGWLYSPHVLAPNTSYSLSTSGLQPGVSYSIHIRAKNNAGLWGLFNNGGVFTVQ